MIALYGKKIGMTQLFDKGGAMVPVTILQIEPSVVVGERDIEKNGYDGKILATFKNRPKLFSKPQLGLFGDMEPRKKVYEVKGFKETEVGTELGVEVFEDTSFVDVTGTSKGKGFQGVMRRYGHSGGPRAHGSKFHRAAGSTGQSATPSRVRKGTKMAGRMGNQKVTVQNLEVVKVDKENNAIIVKGAVPGAIGGAVLIRKAIKKEV